MTANAARATETTGIMLTMEPDPGCALKTLTVTTDAGADVPVDQFSFRMPADNVTVTAAFERAYAITVNTAANGTVAASAKASLAGATVTLTATPQAGYRLSRLTVQDAQGNSREATRNDDGTYGFIMPAVTREQMVTILWRCNGRPAAESRDLSAYRDAGSISDWAREAFAWAVSAGVIHGRHDGALDPKGTATRAEVAQLVMNDQTRAG